MIRPSGAEMHRLEMMAAHVVSVLEDSGWAVDSATSIHPSFRKREGTARRLERDLLRDAVADGARTAGMTPDQVRGGALEIVSLDEMTTRRYRLKTVSRTCDGGYDAVVSPESALLHPLPEEPGSLITHDGRWLIGHITEHETHTLRELVVCRIVGHHGDSLIHLDLDDVHSILPIIPPLGFTPIEDDDLDLGDDDSDDEGELGDGTL